MKRPGEIMDVRHSVFAGQVFAEMLAGICHPEFYSYSDQEVSPPIPMRCDIPRVLCFGCLRAALWVLFTLSSVSDFLRSPPIYSFPSRRSSCPHSLITHTGLRNPHHPHLLPTLPRPLPPILPPRRPRHRLPPLLELRGGGDNPALHAPIRLLRSTAARRVA